MPHVLVVILNWNSAEETRAALASVLAMDYSNLSVVIIDNGSTDDSLGILRQLVRDHVELVVSGENLGYTGGCNLGFDLALCNEADYVWLLNPDAVTEPHTLTSLITIAENDSSIGLLSPAIVSLHDPQERVYLLGKVDLQEPSYQITKDPQTAQRWIATVPDQLALLGTALLVRVSLIRKIGGFDPTFFAYWEDTDLSVRTHQAGFRVAVDLNSVVRHTEKFAKDDPHTIKPHYWYYMARNEIRFWKKHSSRFRLLKALWWHYTKQLTYLKLLKENPTSCQAILAGLWNGWRGRTGPYNERLNMPALAAAVVRKHSEWY